ncbi:hypothetical protein PV11_07309 [Exophiala sideris]|uniref:Uncharacterized protein n=1 Tax=Exophiala sideris TaxID=1016849 RepID=A0A0D1YFU2_9EURO|nr:hypothetical protein PV11_07309 [Exophiala sideris]
MALTMSDRVTPFDSPRSLAIVVVVGTLVFLLLAKYIRRLFFMTPKSVPGPLLARVSRLWYLIQVRRGDWHKVIMHQHRKYGPIVRMAPNYYSIDDPSAIKTLYGSGTKFVKGSWYTVPGDPDLVIRDVFTDLDIRSHAAHRRQIASLYATTSLLKMEPNVNECILELDARFSEITRTGDVINLQWWMQCYAFDVIACISFGSRFGLLDNGKDPLDLIEALHGGMDYVATVGIYPEWHGPIFRLLKRLGSNPMVKTIKFAQQKIDERQRDLKSGVLPDSQIDDFLTKVLRLHDDDPVAFPMAKVFTTCMQNVGAGSDTTSISLSGLMWYLITNPGPLAKLRAEIDDMTAQGRLSDPPTFAETQAMPYFQAVIQEGLRMHPAAAFPLVRIVPEAGAVIAGKFFPAGASVAANCWVAHYNKQVFGDDADEFRPERWFGDKEEVAAMNRYWIPFGHGAGTCLGKNISLMEISKVVPHLLRKYDFKLVDPNAKLKCRYLSFVLQENLDVSIAPRQKV